MKGNYEEKSQILAEEMAELLALREQMKKLREENPVQFISPMQHKFGAFGTSRELDPKTMITIMPPTPVQEATVASKSGDVEDDGLKETPPPAAITCSPMSIPAPTFGASSGDNDDSSVAVEPPTPTTLKVQGGFVIRIDDKQEDTSPRPQFSATGQVAHAQMVTQDVDRNDAGEVNSLTDDGKHDPSKFNEIFDNAIGGGFGELVKCVPPIVIPLSPTKKDKQQQDQQEPLVAEELIVTPLRMREMPTSPIANIGDKNENAIDADTQTNHNADVSNVVASIPSECDDNNPIDSVVLAASDTGKDIYEGDKDQEKENIENEVVTSITEVLTEGLQREGGETQKTKSNHVLATIIDDKAKTRDLSTPNTGPTMCFVDTPIDESSPLNIPIRVVERPSVYPAVSKPSGVFQPAPGMISSSSSNSSAEIATNKTTDVSQSDRNDEKFLGALNSHPDSVVPPRNLALHKNKMLTVDEMRNEFDAEMHSAIRQFGASELTSGSPINRATSPQPQGPTISACKKGVTTDVSIPIETNDIDTSAVVKTTTEIEAMIQDPIATSKKKKNKKKRGVMFADNIENVQVIPNTVITEDEARSLKEIATKTASSLPKHDENRESENSTSSSGGNDITVVGSPPLARLENKERRGEKSRGTIISSTLLSPASSTSSSYSTRDQMASSRSIPTQQEGGIIYDDNSEKDIIFTDDGESSTYYSDYNSDYYYNENMTPNTLTTYGENTPVGFDDSTANTNVNECGDSDNDSNRFTTLRENELQNKHFESWLSPDAQTQIA